MNCASRQDEAKDMHLHTEDNHLSLLNHRRIIKQIYLSSVTGKSKYLEVAGQLQQEGRRAGGEGKDADMLLTRRDGKQQMTTNTFRLRW